MKRWTRGVFAVTLSAILLLSGCGGTGGTVGQESEEAEETVEQVTEEQAESAAVVTNLPTLDMGQWQYNTEDDVYYQIGISYCETPADGEYETLAIFVPGAYLSGTDNGDGTYTCEADASGEIHGYTADTAPIVMPRDATIAKAIR